MYKYRVFRFASICSYLFYYYYYFVKDCNISWKFVMNYEILNNSSLAWRLIKKVINLKATKIWRNFPVLLWRYTLYTVQMSKQNWEISPNLKCDTYSRFSFVLRLDNFYLIFSRLLRKVVQFFTLLQMCRVVQISFLKMSRLKLLKELVWFSTCQLEHMMAARKIRSK